MCYQEVRWHVICNHTVQSRNECPRRCAQYGAIDTIETQLTAYCHACRAHIDNLGIARRRSKRASNVASSLKHSRTRSPAGSVSADDMRLAAGSPTPSVTSLRDVPVSLRNKWNSSMLVGDLRRSISNGSSKAASIGEIMSGLGMDPEAQQWQRQAENQPEMLSPIPQKPRLSLRIPEMPEEPISQCLSSEATLPEDADLRDLSPMTKTSTITSANPTSPRTPSSISASLEEMPSKPPMVPLPSLPLTAPPSKSPFGRPLTSLGRSLQKSKSSSRLASSSAWTSKPQGPSSSATTLGAPARLKSVSHLSIRLSEPLAGPSSSTLPERSPLRRVKSSRTLTDTDSSLGNGVGARDWEIKTVSPPAEMSVMNRPRPRPRGGANYFPAAKRVTVNGGGGGGKKLIDIQDPDWLAKHGLKWGARGLGIVSAAV